jgi:hypothetical protein
MHGREAIAAVGFPEKDGSDRGGQDFDQNPNESEWMDKQLERWRQEVFHRQMNN